MSGPIVRYNARYVLPIGTPSIEDGTVAVDGERIAYVGTRAGAPHGADRNLGNSILLPGLVNAHCHLELTAMRGFLEGLDFRNWILRLTTAKKAVFTREMLFDAARYGIAEGLRHGITTYADTCDSGVVIEALREMGVRGIMYQEVFGPDPAQREGSLAELREKIRHLRPMETSLVRLGISPHAPYTVSDALFSGTAMLARAEQLPIAVHIAESQLEYDLVVGGTGAFADGLRARGITVSSRARSPIALLASLGVLDARPLLIHCVRVDSSDISTIADARCPVAHCPVSNAKLGHGIAPVQELLAAGIVVGLGSDSVASNNRMDLLSEARHASLFQRARTGTPEAMPAASALALATLGGARALGIDGEIGSLEPGKSADLAAFSLDGMGPTFDPETAAVFAMAGSRASFVTVAGSPLVVDGQLVRGDVEALEQSVDRSASKLESWLTAR